jgi:cytochrome P450
MSAAADCASARFAAASGPVDAFDQMVTATFEVIADVTLSGGPEAKAGIDRDAVHRAIEGYIGQTARLSVLDIIGAPAWVPRPGRLFTGGQMRQIKSTADAAIARRRAEGARPIPDLLDLLMAGHDPASGRQMSPDELRDNLLTFIVAGHETTALTLANANNHRYH